MCKITGYHSSRVQRQDITCAGPLERMHRPKDQKSGEPREFAFITFEDEDSVPYALELFKDTRLYGRPIRMQAKGAVKEPRRGAHVRSVTAPPAPLLAPAPWRPPPPPPPRNDVMLHQMAAQQMLMLAQQAALGQQRFQPGLWQQQAPPGFMPPQRFGPFGGPPPRGRHHQRSNTHHW
ncbi:uncharacterized protein LOC119094068 isoform X2 [Pollicipes pollicipes]|uniref:uncharacterized protein LOC119094068 isoform X2 n=1 Tax=Pollicipes pollicipes TaxID=41117 RepID=UPI001884B429|nr:uncharacterized protein LOC119094068 isoform X2 [Pollicipes pollicipes]